ncbi:MAG: putative toxin-antitoxin system toxin component, PIN family [Nanoarchaeota archaeon]
MRVVLDTNVFVSGIHWAGSSEKILRAWIEGKFELVSSLPIIEEIVRILANFKLPLDADDISWWESLILEKSLVVVPSEEVDIVKNDPDDNKFIEAALEAQAEYIISQDKHLLLIKEYRGIKIVHPDDFSELL